MKEELKNQNPEKKDKKPYTRKDFLQTVLMGGVSYLVGGQLTKQGLKHYAKSANHGMPELVKEGAIDKVEIEKYVNDLEEDERKELALCFDQYKDSYAKYNDLDNFSKEKEKHLYLKFYGLFAKYCKNFSFIPEDPKDYAGSNSADKISYFFPEEEVNQPDSLMKEEKLFAINPVGMSNFFILIAELSHSVQGDSTHTRNKKFLNDELRARDSLEVYKKAWLSPNFTEKDIKDYFKYTDPTFAEYQAHQITEKAILFYLLDAIKHTKEFEEVYDFSKNIYSEVIKNTSEKSNEEKSSIISTLIRPSVLNLIQERDLNVQKLIDSIIVFKNLHKEKGFYLGWGKLLKEDPEGLLDIEKHIKVANSFVDLCMNFIGDSISVEEFAREILSIKKSLGDSSEGFCLINSFSLDKDIYNLLEGKIKENDPIWEDLAPLLFSQYNRNKDLF